MKEEDKYFCNTCGNIEVGVDAMTRERAIAHSSWCEPLQKSNKRIAELEKEVTSLKKNIVSLESNTEFDEDLKDFS